MTSVPNWIAKAVIFRPTRSEFAEITATTGWRATRTQVIVTVDGPRGPVERRFRLDSLTEVGYPRYDRTAPQLKAPDALPVVEALKADVVYNARVTVLMALDGLRLQDSGQSAEVVAAKLAKLADAVNKALAEIGTVL
jgi:hypothetical protein